MQERIGIFRPFRSIGDACVPVAICPRSSVFIRGRSHPSRDPRTRDPETRPYSTAVASISTFARSSTSPDTMTTLIAG